MSLMKNIGTRLQFVDGENTTEITPLDDGYIGKIAPNSPTAQNAVEKGTSGTGAKLVLTVCVDDEAQENIIGFTVDDKKNIEPKRNEYMALDPALSPEDNLALAKKKGRKSGNHKEFSINLEVKWSRKAEAFHTQYPRNNIRLLKFNETDVELWELSVVSLNGEFYYNEQMTYRWELYSDKGKIVSNSNTFSEWPGMVQLMNSVVGKNVTRLPDIKFARKISKVDGGTPPPFAGMVLYYNIAKGVGAIWTDHGQARAHWSAINRPERKQFLLEGEIVTYTKLVEPNSADPTLQTAFQFEARGINPWQPVPIAEIK